MCPARRLSHHGRVHPAVDDFRALARSSPWLWQRLHFTRWDGPERRGGTEAWLDRPGRLRVRPHPGAEERVSGVPYSSTGSREMEDPVLRPDGLVEVRPDGWHFEHGDPMWRDYTWTAVLDPEELSHDVAVTDVDYPDAYDVALDVRTAVVALS